MNMRKEKVFVALVLALTLSVSVFGAGQRRNQQQEEAQPIGPAPNSKEELDAFMALQNEQDPTNKLTLADAFVAKYPASDLVSYAHAFRSVIFNNQRKLKESVGAAEQALDATVKFGEKIIGKAEADAKLPEKEKNKRKKDKKNPFLDKESPQYQTFVNDLDKRILDFYQMIMVSYQQMNDMPKAFEWGQKAIAYKPDDLNMLMTVTNIMAERPPADEAQKVEHLKRAEELSNEAITQLTTYMASPAAAQATPAQKADFASGVHYNRGLIYLHQKKYAESQKDFLTALTAKKSDPVTYYRLGFAYAQDQKIDQAMDALAKSVFLKGVAEASARDILKQLYVMKNKSDQGMEEFIKTAGTKIGQ
jgi:tetratricopeptide (TPR) repeat protein